MLNFAVVPLVGTWIEMMNGLGIGQGLESFPSWERGLKSLPAIEQRKAYSSFPSWERGLKSSYKYHSHTFYRRSPRGNVD